MIFWPCLQDQKLQAVEHQEGSFRLFNPSKGVPGILPFPASDPVALLAQIRQHWLIPALLHKANKGTAKADSCLLLPRMPGVLLLPSPPPENPGDFILYTGEKIRLPPVISLLL